MPLLEPGTSPPSMPGQSRTAGSRWSAVVEKYSDKSAAFASQFGIKRQYTTVEELLKDGGADALVIGTPNFLHAPQALAALQSGIPVLVEKPMAMNAVEAGADAV